MTIVRQDIHASSTKSKVYVKHANNPAELRELVTRARQDPYVIKHSEESFRMLEGDEPTHCQCGYRYITGGTMNDHGRKWHQCDCGGHLVYTCPKCGHVIIEPPASYDCTELPGYR